MSAKANNTDSRSYQAQPTYWFAVLEIARERGDFAEAAEAKQRLSELGVRVNYQRLRGRQEVTR